MRRLSPSGGLGAVLAASLALVSEKLGQLDAAKRLLGWTLILEAGSPDVAAIKSKIIELEVARERAERDRRNNR
ncbi:MAG: hypothetical protein HY553_13065 [Elusimicrobia bacterium]|nr:hypothetical protein [Elusimicrobiota bacterium]